ERVEVVTIAHENGLVTLRDRPCGPLDARRDSARDLDALGVVDALTDNLLTIGREQRGMVERNQDELAGVPIVFGDAERRVRDLDGHLARVTDAAESTRQTIAEALNLYLSIAAESLTRIATVLLPLTVVGGFFG